MTTARLTPVPASPRAPRQRAARREQQVPAAPAPQGPLLSEPVWRADAGCAREQAVYFFAPGHFERKEEKDAREGVARALCRACPVRRECLEHSLTTAESHGIWGGLNELERRRLLRKRASEAPRSA